MGIVTKDRKKSGTASLSILHKLRHIFDRKQKEQSVILAVMILIGGLLETLGVSSILTVVQSLMDPDKLHTSIEKINEKVPFTQTLMKMVGLDDDNSIIVFMLIALILIFVINSNGDVQPGTEVMKQNRRLHRGVDSAPRHGTGMINQNRQCHVRQILW